MGFHGRRQKCTRNSLIYLSISTELFALIINLIYICILNLSLNIAEIRANIFSETPIYGFNLSSLKPNNNELYIKSFYEFQGKERKEYDSNKKKYKTIIYDNVDIAKIYNHFFIYNKDERTYFDYLKSYSVNPGQNCQQYF